MSEAPQAPAGAETAAAPKTARGQSYWQLVWGQFLKNGVAFKSTIVILILFLLAAWAPLLASGYPIVWRENGVTTYPLLRQMTAPEYGNDYPFNFLCFATVTIPLLWLLRRFVIKQMSLRVMILGGLTLALLPFIGNPTGWFSETRGFNPLRRWFNDSTNYLEKAESLDKARGDYVIFPLVNADPLTPTPRYLKPPGGNNYMGTDKDGRDVLARMLHGARISLSVGFVAVLIEIIIGIFFGALAGYYRGWVDVVISRFIELVICFPSFFLILTIVAFIDPSKRSIFHIMIIMGVTGWTGIARLVRGEFLKLSELEFVQSARALGCPNSRLMFRHILPNALAPVLVSAAFGIAGAILTESGLSYLGFGAPPPQPTWGEMISQGKEHVDTAWWLVVFPGAAIFLTVTIYNLAGDGLRDAMDPKMRK